MEYTKDILLDAKEGQDRTKRRKKKNRLVITVLVSIISFIVLDAILVSNFINILLNA